MGKIAVFADRNSAICDFFDAERILLYERGSYGWESIGKGSFKKISADIPDLARKKTEALLPLIEGCDVLAGGVLSGIPYSVFDRAGLRIFKIDEISDDALDDIMEYLLYMDVVKKEDVKYTESPNNIYFLDLVVLPEGCPGAAGKTEAADNDIPFLELRFTCFCRHIPLWLKDCGAYSVKTVGVNDGAIQVVVAPGRGG